ncbi:hypothetical protein [Sphingomonas sp. BK580]|jgi:hypothetical protein|uniref:hypothetical protein n=1 Tax=Sphingomonas sp. BK580 TaxID=2586972 RepID=UPI001620F497|nr:hypothetical protein [Sphingomonas sp. BK580]MBB3694853.1 hypothetical protein [Sphingomonas sp. BK580]
MLDLIVILFAGVSTADAPTPAVVCEVGRVALRDLEIPHSKSGDTSYYVDVDPTHPGLLKSCPELREMLPAGYSAADNAAWSRANVHAPVPGKPISPTFIYSFGVPKVSADGKSATVEWSYTCSGLCGGGLVSRYVRTSQGWRLDGKPQMKWVS